MKASILRFSKRYHTELLRHLRAGSPRDPRPAEKLGVAGMELGLETLDLAGIHSDAFAEAVPRRCAPVVMERMLKRAGRFFVDVITPVENTRRSTAKNLLRLERANFSLQQRTVELSSANHLLSVEVQQRKQAERSLRQSERRHRALLRDAHQMERRLRHLSHQVLSAQEAERKQISRELHDEIVQTLTGINVQLATLKVEAGTSKERFAEHITYTQSLVETSVDIVHRFARDLRPALLDDLGLIPALQAYLKSFTTRTGIRVGLVTFADVERLRHDLRTVLYRVAQAALVNTDQHAQASRAEVVIRRVPEGVLMEVKDDGKSFDVARMLDARHNKRLGLVGMRERVEMVGGIFKVDSDPGIGTVVSALLPFRHTRNSQA